MDKKGCVINPLTGRAIKTTGKTYKKLQKKYKDTTAIQAVIKRNKAEKVYQDKLEAKRKLSSVIKRAANNGSVFELKKRMNQLNKSLDASKKRIDELKEKFRSKFFLVPDLIVLSNLQVSAEYNI